MSDPVYVLMLDQVPPPQLTPNRALRRGGFHAASAAKASYRAYAAYSALEGPRTGFSGDVDVDVLVTYPRSSRAIVDVDALALMLKPAIDGLADAGVIENDRCIRRISYERTRGDVPGVRIEVKAA